MPTVRELVTKWLFKADTSGVSRFEAAINRAKAAAKLAATGIAAVTTASAAGGRALYHMTEAMAEHADEIGKAAAKTGLGTDLLQQLKATASKTEVAFKPLVKGLASFTRQTYAAAHGNKAAKASFADLGMSLKDSHGKLKSNDDLVTEAIFNLSQMEDVNRRNTIAQKLFGVGSREMGQMFEEGAQGLAAMMDEARKSGKVLGKDTVEAGDKMDKQLRALKGTVGLFKMQLGSALLPAVGGIISKINDWVKANKGLVSQKIQEVAAKIAEALRDLMDAASKGDLFGKLTSVLKALIDALSWILRHGTAVKWLFITLIGLSIATKLSPLIGVLKGVGGALFAMAGTSGGLIGNLTGVIGKLGLLGAAAGAGYAVGTMLDRLTGASDKLSSALLAPQREIQRLRALLYNNVKMNTHVRDQAQMYADMMKRGVKYATVEGGQKMALTRENVAGRLAQQAARLKISKEDADRMIPAALDAAGLTQNNTMTINVQVGPGTPADQAKKTGEALGKELPRRMRQALPAVSK